MKRNLRHVAMNEALLVALCMGNLTEGETATVGGGGDANAPDVEAPKAEKKVRKAKPAKSAAKKIAKPKAAKKVKKAKATGGKAMEALKRARKEYKVDKSHKTAGGNVSVHCGDATAKKLVGADLNKVYEMAAKVKDVSAGTLKAKYRHLNPGAQRMTLGNIIRAAS